MRLFALTGLLLLAACPKSQPNTTCTQDGDCTRPAVCCLGKCVDVQTSASNCGRCGAVCSTAHGAAKCGAGVCSIACSSGYGDCNKDTADGCESDLSSEVNHCGKCTTVCMADNAASVCDRSKCLQSSCNTGFGDCDGLEGNGCEVDLRKTLVHCGACNKKCEVPEGTGACVDSACTVAACNADYGDCDKQALTGCETDLRVTDAHCSACGMACPAGYKCKGSKCVAPELLFYGGLLNVTSALATAQVSSFNVDTRAWASLTTTGTDTPGTRAGHLAVWDAQGQRMLVWGGFTTNMSPADTEVYALDFSQATPAWSKLSVAGPAPTSRSFMGTAWDKSRRVLYVYGGSDTAMNQAYDELWELDVANLKWTKRTEAGAPGGRYLMAMAWDAPRQRVLLGLGIDNSGGPVGGFSAFDPADGGTGWSTPATTNAPSARAGAPFLGDAAPLHLYGGIDDFGMFATDTYVVDTSDAGLAFTALAPATTPGERGYFAGVSGPERRFLYGGFEFDQISGNLTSHSDVWEFGADAGWARIADGGVNFAHPGTVFVSAVARE